MELTTERLVLREFVEDDWTAVWAYQVDPRYLRYYHQSTRSEADARAFVQMFVRQQFARPRSKFQLAMILRTSGELIGNCGIRLALGRDGSADLGYEVAPDHWGRGYATEAARAMLAFGFEQLDLRRVTADCIADNRASARVLEKLGMTLVQRQVAAETFKGRAWDVLHYALERADRRPSGGMDRANGLS